MGALALLLTLLASGSDVLHATFDGAQEGALPAIVVDRPMDALQRDGTIVPAHEPRWGDPRASPVHVGGWTWALDEGGAITLMFSGVDADDATPLLVTFNADQMMIRVHLGQRLGNEAAFEHDTRRIEGSVTTVDLLLGTHLEEADRAYRPRAGTVLPGCVLFLCQRARRVESPDLAWLAEGVSVIALEHLRSGWRWRVIGHVDPIGGDDRALGRERVYASSMANCFPDPLGVVDGRLVDAWIPFVDYLHHVPDPATAGQCMLLRARRTMSGSSPWSFDGPVLLHEFFSGEKRHTHAAAWTPNGVLLSIGDGRDSEVALLTCDGEGNWTDPESWTIHHDVHGAPLADGEGGDVGANQFWSAAPGPDPNTVIVGGDNVSGAIMRANVPEDPEQGIRFERLWGVQPGDSVDNGASQCTCSLLARPRPEASGPLLARFYLEASVSNVADARLVLSEDFLRFATVGSLRPQGSKTSPAALHGTALLTTPVNSMLKSGIWSRPVPDLVMQRPLLLGPGSVDQLHRDDMIGDLAITGEEGVQVSTIPRGGADDLSAHAAEAPGVNPVWRVHRPDAGAADLVSITLPTPDGGWPEGALWVQGWMSNLTAGMLRPQLSLDLGAHDAARRVAIASQQQWVPVDLVTDADDPTAGATPTLHVQVPVFADAISPPVDFLFTIASMTCAQAPPWPTAEAVAHRPPERMSLALPAASPPWMLELDLYLPEHGLDRGLGDSIAPVTIMQLDLADGAMLELVADVLFARVRLDHVAQDGTRVQILERYDVRLSRLDTFRIVLAAGIGSIGLDISSGGRRDPADLIAGEPFPTLTALDTLHLGTADEGLSTPLELLRVSLWPDQAHLDVGLVPEAPANICPADFDDDGVVGGSDILVLLMGWGDCPGGDDPPDCPADLTEDGLVDVHDLLLVLTSLGPCPGE